MPLQISRHPLSGNSVPIFLTSDLWTVRPTRALSPSERLTVRTALSPHALHHMWRDTDSFMHSEIAAWSSDLPPPGGDPSATRQMRAPKCTRIAHLRGADDSASHLMSGKETGCNTPIGMSAMKGGLRTPQSRVRSKPARHWVDGDNVPASSRFFGRQSPRRRVFWPQGDRRCLWTSVPRMQARCSGRKTPTYLDSSPGCVSTCGSRWAAAAVCLAVIGILAWSASGAQAASTQKLIGNG